MRKLTQFVDIQNDIYPQVLIELKNGYKSSNWIHNIFPRLAVDPKDQQVFFHLKNTHEAKAYQAHPVLGARLIECVQLLLKVQNKTILSILGSPDFLHFKSSMTLFATISDGHSIFHQILEKYFSGKMDTQTFQAIKEEAEQPASDHLIWLQEFNSQKSEPENIKELRTKIFKETIQISINSSYQTPQNTIIFETPKELARNVTFYEAPRAIQTFSNKYKTQIIVTESNCIDQAQILIAADCNPVIHIENNRIYPGNDALEGELSTEADVFRRSNIGAALYQFTDDAEIFQVKRDVQHSYPITKETGGIYVPYVSVFRGSEKNGYYLLNKNLKLDFVLVPAYENTENVNIHGDWRLQEKYVPFVKEKIRTILRIAFAHQHDSIILNAFGCDKFQYPPQHIAELFSEIIRECEFKNIFKMIVFAIEDSKKNKKEETSFDNLYEFYTTFN
ncbi:MAG TPA: TIGR02452 family protein [Chitinophagales bacterium]|nr:TIGR02452 family protein [Chitinophagales bacterium]